MSFDLHVFGSSAVEGVDVEAAVHAVPGCRLAGDGDPSGAFVVERKIRGGFDDCFNVDGPFQVEREDLPPAVIGGAVGVRWTLQISVEGSDGLCIRLARRFAQGLAERAEGVVYDPQLDGIAWPRGGTRTFRPAPEQTIDVVQLEWFVRREDAAASSSSAILYDTVEQYLPEALPRRFGSFEPLQGRLDQAGRDGFVDAWRNEPTSFSWKGARPCLFGSMSGLADELPLFGGQPTGPNPVGSVSLDLDGRAFRDRRWNEDVVACFAALSERLTVFFAQAAVLHDVNYSGGNIWFRMDSITNPGLVVRNVWMGLPGFDLWLAWFGTRYRDLVADHLPADLVEGRDTGLLLRTAAGPAVGGDAGQRTGPSPFVPEGPEGRRDWRLPQELVLRVSGEPPGGWVRERADVVPEGL